MPHLIIEYSANIADSIDMPHLMERLNHKAVETGVFPLGGIRTRAHRCDEYRIADGNPENAFIHIWVRIGVGRDVETRRSAGQALFDILADHVAHIFDERPLTIGLELGELHPELNFKKNNIHARLKALAEAGSP